MASKNIFQKLKEKERDFGHTKHEEIIHSLTCPTRYITVSLFRQKLTDTGWKSRFIQKSEAD